MSRTALLLASLAGCDCMGGGGGGSPRLVFLDENNYAYDSTLDVTELEVQAGVSSHIDWADLSVDLRGRAVDPADIDQITLLGFDVTKAELFDLFASNDINQDDTTSQYLNVLDGETAYELEDMETVGLFIDLPAVWVENPNQTWLLSLMNTYDDRLDILMSKVLVPLDASTNTEVTLGDGDTTLTVDVDLHSAPAITTAAGKAPYQLDWTQVTTDVYGNPFDPLEGDQLILARYDLSVDEIEAQFKQLDTVPDVAKELYRLDVRGLTGSDLSGAIDAEGNAFGGFTTEGTWLVGVICQTCANPAPLLLARVEVR